jgi:hypothetical protein
MIEKITRNFIHGTLGVAIINTMKRKFRIYPTNRFSVDSQNKAISLLVEQSKKWLGNNDSYLNHQGRMPVPDNGRSPAG